MVWKAFTLRRCTLAAGALSVVVAVAGISRSDEAESEPRGKQGTGLLGLIRAVVSGAAAVQSESEDVSIELDSLAGTDSAEDAGPAEAVTHSRIVKVPIKSDVRAHSLQNFCLTPEGHAVVLLGLPRYSDGSEAGKASRTGEVRVLSIDENGKTQVLQSWKTDFSPQSVNVDKSGVIFVAGDGKIAKFQKDGELIAAVDAPHLKTLLADRDLLKKRAQEQIEEELASYDQQVKMLEQMRDAQVKRRADVKKSATKEKAKEAESEEAADDEEDPDKDREVEAVQDDGTKVKYFMPSLNNQIKQMKLQREEQAKQTVEQVVEGIVSRMKIMNAIAIGEKDVFIASAASKGYGYDVWRMDHAFENAEKIVTSLSGCCGQMDIQCDGECVFVAENSRHRVVKYDREGKKVATWGKTDRMGRGAGFGSCCNPMNLRFDQAGTLFTAESEGKIKKFSPTGEFQGLIAHVKVEQGCKNVPIAMSTDGKRAYFCDLPGHQLIVAFESDAAAKPDQSASLK